MISTDIVPTLKDRLKACGVDEYARVAQKIRNRSLHLPKTVVNDKEVSDHHAIIPTEQDVMLEELSNKERKIYDLVIKRFLAVLSEPHEFEEIIVRAEIGGEQFQTSGNIIKKLGWKEVYQGTNKNEAEDNNNGLVKLKEGKTFNDITVKQKTGETKPPSNLTEGTLLQAMENPAKYMHTDDKHLEGTIHSSGGLGTVATRADIIEKLFTNMYMELRGKHIFLTSKGKQLLDLVPKDLKSPALTAEWEKKLNLIASGKLKKQQFIAEMKQYTKEVVQEVKASDDTFKHDNLTGSKCPKCNKLMLEIDNRNGKMLVCQDRACGHKKNILKRTNARCPKCKKKLELHGEGEGQIFMCRCGHREKLSTFNKRKQHEKKHKVSKKEVNKYLNKQDEGFKNNALADQLAKFKK